MREILNWCQESGIVIVAVGSGVAAGFLLGAAVHSYRFGAADLPGHVELAPAACIKLEYAEPRARAALLPRAAPAVQPETEEREPW